MTKQIVSKRNFRKLRCSMSNERFFELCEDIAMLYAEKGPVYARTHHKEKYCITDKCYSKLLAYAIICNIVTEDVVDSIEKKSIMYKDFLSAEAVEKIQAYYSNLRSIRHKYILATFSNERIVRIVKCYTELNYVSKDDLAKKYKTSVRIIDALLTKSIIKNIISDEMLEKLERTCILKDPTEYTTNIFKKFREERNFRRTALE